MVMASSSRIKRVAITLAGDSQSQNLVGSNLQVVFVITPIGPKGSPLFQKSVVQTFDCSSQRDEPVTFECDCYYSQMWQEEAGSAVPATGVISPQKGAREVLWRKIWNIFSYNSASIPEPAERSWKLGLQAYFGPTNLQMGANDQKEEARVLDERTRKPWSVGLDDLPEETSLCLALSPLGQMCISVVPTAPVATIIHTEEDGASSSGEEVVTSKNQDTDARIKAMEDTIHSMRTLFTQEITELREQVKKLTEEKSQNLSTQPTTPPSIRPQADTCACSCHTTVAFDEAITKVAIMVEEVRKDLLAERNKLNAVEGWMRDVEGRMKGFESAVSSLEAARDEHIEAIDSPATKEAAAITLEQLDIFRKQVNDANEITLDALRQRVTDVNAVALEARRTANTAQNNFQQTDAASVQRTIDSLTDGIASLKGNMDRLGAEVIKINRELQEVGGATMTLWRERGVVQSAMGTALRNKGDIEKLQRSVGAGMSSYGSR
ncbi:hypothetical protein BXZ70DRAFT_123204 [Cristinia sonorae]|uniref:Uncharacterized protein n=1 Tax=Cristinia sonorae TaxID=1940300 RepID=A0A8K0UPN3_9AGAR|nr:hypothetical protein BXZ70DRAFT_123204 [Cristinia sonorae]